MEDRFWPPEAPKPLKRFTCNLACMIMSTIRPTRQNGTRRKGRGVGRCVTLYPSMLVLLFLYLERTYSSA